MKKFLIKENSALSQQHKTVGTTISGVARKRLVFRLVTLEIDGNDQNALTKMAGETRQNIFAFLLLVLKVKRVLLKPQWRNYRSQIKFKKCFCCKTTYSCFQEEFFQAI